MSINQCISIDAVELSKNKCLLINFTFILTVIICSLLLTGCNRDSHDHPDLVTGKQLFDYHCSSCHKTAGTGNFLWGVPASKDTELSSSQISHKVRSDEQKGSKMPAFPGMGTEEAAKISRYVKTL